MKIRQLCPWTVVQGEPVSLSLLTHNRIEEEKMGAYS